MINPRRGPNMYHGDATPNRVLATGGQAASSHDIEAIKRRAQRAKALRLQQEAINIANGVVDGNAMGPWAQMRADRGYM